MTSNRFPNSPPAKSPNTSLPPLRGADVTVLLSLYSGETPAHLDLALRSLFEQTLPDFHVIIVLDGPISIPLRSCLDHWALQFNRGGGVQRLRLIPLNQPSGLGIALQQGLEAVTTPLLARFDTDDFCFPDRLERQLNFLLENPEISVLGTALTEFEESPLKPLRLKPAATDPERIRSRIWLRNPLNHPTVMFRVDAIRAVGGYRHFHCLEDYDLWCRALASGLKMTNLPDPLVAQRIGDRLYDRRAGTANYINEIRLRWEMWRRYRLIGIGGVILAALLQIPLRLGPRILRRRLWQSFRRPATSGWKN